MAPLISAKVGGSRIYNTMSAQQIGGCKILNLLVKQQTGGFRVYSQTLNSSKIGGFRVNNNIAGYNVYIGYNILPNLTQPPTQWSATLPISISITPPASGTLTLYVLVLAQDSYGLESQNQFYTTITIDSSGNLVLPVIAAPQNLALLVPNYNTITVQASYPNFSVDKYPATSWKIWVGTTLPLITDTPVLVIAATNVLVTSVSPYSPNIYYVMVGLYRAADNYLSPTIYGTVTLNPAPDQLVAIPSGFQE